MYATLFTVQSYFTNEHSKALLVCSFSSKCFFLVNDNCLCSEKSNRVEGRFSKKTDNSQQALCKIYSNFVNR